MPDDELKQITPERPAEQPLRAEEIGFRTDELVVCAKCARPNPPNRLKCVYCGAELALSDAQKARVTPVLRRLEAWENGFNVIARPVSAAPSGEVLQTAARIVGGEPETVAGMLAAGAFLPLARAETAAEAELVRARLAECGVETFVVGDEMLAADRPPRRLRGLEFAGPVLRLRLFNTDELVELDTAGLGLLVAGAIFEKSVESTEKRKKGENRIIDAVETASDELLLDLYPAADAQGFRIPMKGFDFSCLGAAKGMLARDNLRRLADRLAAETPALRRVENYAAVRHLLGAVWEIEERRESKGLTRQRFGKFDLSNVSSSSNLRQFTKFSRLQWFAANV